MAIDFDNNETYDLFMAAFDKALQLDTFENRGRVRQMFRDQMKQLAAAQARIAELEAEIVKWKELTGLDEPSWDATLPDLSFATLPVILQGVGKSTADVSFDWMRATSATDSEE